MTRHKLQLLGRRVRHLNLKKLGSHERTTHTGDYIERIDSEGSSVENGL